MLVIIQLASSVKCLFSVHKQQKTIKIAIVLFSIVAGGSQSFRVGIKGEGIELKAKI